MIYFFAILFVICGIIIVFERRRRLQVANPATWPPNSSINQLVTLTNSYLKKNGWTILESNRPLNIFIRAKREHMWLTMMVHGPETLSLSTLMSDTAAKTADLNLTMGILSTSAFPENVKEDALRAGLYVINPTDLAHVATFIHNTQSRKVNRVPTSAVLT